MGIRITDQGMTDARMGWISDGRATVAEMEQRVSSGRRIDQASDSPGASARLMRHDMRLQRIHQYQRNNENAKLWIGAADAGLMSASNNLARARTLAVQAGNDTLGPTERAALGSDIRAVAQEVLTIANTKVSGRPIFAGTAGAGDAYDQSGNYLGDAGVVSVAIDTAQTVVIGSTGPNVFGTSNAGDPMNGSVFEMLEALATAVDAGDNAGVRAGIEAIDTASSLIASTQGQVGAISQALDANTIRHDSERLAVEGTVSKLRDTDLAEGVIRLRSAEAGYEATLAATARGLSRSLLDFLR